MKPFERRKHLEAIFATKLWAQFGQRHDKSTANGSEACTHVVLQAHIYLWTGQDVTIDEISAATGYKPGDVGMNSTHVDKAIAHWKLPLTATFRMATPPTTDGLIQIVRNLGPALIAVDYGLYPLDKRFGSSNSAFRGGRTDLGFAGNHAVCLFAARWLKKRHEYRPRVMDPDHGSPARPDIPDFDTFTDKQLGRMWNHPLVGKTYSRFGYIPTREWTGVPTND
jgi:hypothetical protein